MYCDIIATGELNPLKGSLIFYNICENLMFQKIAFFIFVYFKKWLVPENIHPPPPTEGILDMDIFWNL